jgi:hypothetical protein
MLQDEGGATLVRQLKENEKVKRSTVCESQIKNAFTGKTGENACKAEDILLFKVERVVAFVGSSEKAKRN